MSRGYVHLDELERIAIGVWLGQGLRVSRIALALGRSRSTILRELRRNGWKGKRGGLELGYDPIQAERRARRLAHQPRVMRKLEVGSRLWGRVVGFLRQGLSPAQIARTLKDVADPERLSHETIYTTLYAMPRGQLRSDLLKLMRRQKACN